MIIWLLRVLTGYLVEVCSSKPQTPTLIREPQVQQRDNERARERAFDCVCVDQTALRVG